MSENRGLTLKSWQTSMSWAADRTIVYIVAVRTTSRDECACACARVYNITLALAPLPLQSSRRRRQLVVSRPHDLGNSRVSRGYAKSESTTSCVRCDPEDIRADVWARRFSLGFYYPTSPDNNTVHALVACIRVTVFECVRMCIYIYKQSLSVDRRRRDFSLFALRLRAPCPLLYQIRF